MASWSTAVSSLSRGHDEIKDVLERRRNLRGYGGRDIAILLSVAVSRTHDAFQSIDREAVDDPSSQNFAGDRCERMKCISSVKKRDYRQRTHIDKGSHRNQQLHQKRNQCPFPIVNPATLTVPIRIPQERRFRTKQAKRDRFCEITAALPVSPDHVWGDNGGRSVC